PRPANVAVAGAQMPRRRRPSQASDRTSRSIDGILGVLADRLPVAERMVLLEEAVKKDLFRRAAHLTIFQRPERAQRNDERGRIDFDRRFPPWGRVPGGRVKSLRSCWRQINAAGAVQ